MIGEPYAGKPPVRFDEGELEIEPFGYYASSLLYWSREAGLLPVHDACNGLVSAEGFKQKSVE